MLHTQLNGHVRHTTQRKVAMSRCVGMLQEKVLLTCTDKVDVWAVGILTYELLVGRPPFEKESRVETYQYIMNESPSFPPWMSEGARDFINCALAKVIHIP